MHVAGNTIATPTANSSPSSSRSVRTVKGGSIPPRTPNMHRRANIHTPHTRKGDTMLHYNETSYGALIIWDSEDPENDIMLQGDDAEYLSAMLEACETDEAEQQILSQYF